MNNHKNELIERYIYAVTHHLPVKMRADVEKELDSLISEMLAGRCGDILPTDKDVRVVLTELGTPEELAAKYSGDENKSLISGMYFLLYKRVLKIVIPIAAAAIAFASLLAMILEWDPTSSPYMLFGKAIGQIIGGAAAGVFQSFAIITFIFAILEYKKEAITDGDMFSRLPQIPNKSKEIKVHEPIIGIVWAVLAAAIFLSFPHIVGAWTESAGWIPLFDTAVVRSYWLPIILWSVLGIVKEAVKLTDGLYTPRLAVVTIIADILTGACAAVMFLDGRIMNPGFVSNIGSLLVGEGGAAISGLVARFNLLFLGIVCFALILEMVTTAVKAWTSRD